MSRLWYPRFWPAVLLLTLGCACLAPSATAQDKPQGQGQPSASTVSQSQKMTKETRLQVIRSLQSERVFARVMFPQGDKGLTLKDGQISPSQQALAQSFAELGPAAKPGDRCVITNVEIKDKEIVLDINGGGKKKQKWYQHISISGNGGADAQLPGTAQSLDAHGSSVTLQFDKFVPEMSGDDVRAMLAPVLDFKALTGTQAYQETLPPKLKAAIHDHKILVGMDKEMVMYARGRPQQRLRDKDEQGIEYEEWIYGTPPEEVQFVRFHGDEVCRLETMNVDGKKEVRTAREVDMPVKEAEVAEQKPTPKPQNGPSLRRPGEEAEFPPPTSDHRTTRPQDTSAPASGSPNPDATGTNVPSTPPISPTGNPPHIAPAK